MHEFIKLAYGLLIFYHFDNKFIVTNIFIYLPIHLFFQACLVCADTFRAGAYDQLKQNATKEQFITIILMSPLPQKDAYCLFFHASFLKQCNDNWNMLSDFSIRHLIAQYFKIAETKDKMD